MKLIKFGVEDRELYSQCLALRDAILRKPHGRSVYDDDLELEKGNSLFGIVEDGKLIATATVIDEGEGHAFIKSVAVEPSLQGGGHGSALMKYLLDDLRARGFIDAKLKARETAIDFYLKCGLVIASEKFYNEKIKMDSAYMEYVF